MKPRLRDWIRVWKNGSKRAEEGFVFTIDEDGCIHYWYPRRSMGHRVAISGRDIIQVVLRNVRLKRDGPEFLAMYASDDLPWSAWQTLKARR